MNARTVDLMCRCQATGPKAHWWNRTLRCYQRPGHEGPHSWQLTASERLAATYVAHRSDVGRT